MEINDIIKTGKTEDVNSALTNAFGEASAGGILLVIKKLFKERGDDIDVNAVDGDGETALFKSSIFGHIGVTTFLLPSSNKRY